MARGRTVDSDAFGSGPHGGRGRGRSTCVRAGTIPPPSSSGTFGASSSTQPPMPSSLPSIPSSSTPLPGPVESSPASLSPTAPVNHKFHKLSFQLYTNYLSVLIAFVTSFAASLEPRNKLSLVARHIYPFSRASRQIMRIIKLHLDKDGYTWDAVPQEARDFYWEEFQKHFVWEKAITAMLKVAWEKLCALQYADFTYRMRKSATSGPQPDHSAEEITALRVCVDDQERQLAELRAHVMRMYGQPGAGTSSSDTPPATDRDVSTALHWPLPSPLDPDTVDDTLVTPVDTMTHPADTPPSAYDQPRIFDFGPF
ncbi:hypothetical protein JCGZ_15249 [Jatropha curcas]|uniref:Uncharacterized protein n=1 Tax=Jatropha curcas TaxID=180498 RepID=A0A067KE57_JATCU|nr:hypothetical protein JCGZ_15249 [Jatropha curcas]